MYCISSTALPERGILNRSDTTIRASDTNTAIKPEYTIVISVPGRFFFICTGT